jgi:ABC-2 type transport system permease protein
MYLSIVQDINISMVNSTGSHSVSPLPVVLTLAQRELVRFFRQRNRVIGALVQPIMFWGLFSLGFRSSGLGTGYFFPGTIAMILLFTAIFATVSIIEDRREGFLQSVLVAPAPRWAMVLGKIVGGSVIALLQALIFLVLGWFTLDLASSPGDVLSAVVLMAVIAVALTALGFFLAWRMESTQGFHAIMTVFLFPMWLLSGAMFPDEAGNPLTLISRLNPLTYGVAGLRHYLQFADVEIAVDRLPDLSVCWLVTLVFAAVMLALAWRIAGTRTTGDLQ